MSAQQVAHIQHCIDDLFDHQQFDEAAEFALDASEYCAANAMPLTANVFLLEAEFLSTCQ